MLSRMVVKHPANELVGGCTHVYPVPGQKSYGFREEAKIVVSFVWVCTHTLLDVVSGNI